jgi:hypothetical protein
MRRALPAHATLNSALFGHLRSAGICSRHLSRIKVLAKVFRLGTGAGSVGYWTNEWRDEHVFEIGWMVAPDFQGRGIAVAATAQAIERAKRDDKHRFMHAFPGVDNAPSNAICRQQRSVSGSRSSDHSLCATPGGMTTQSPARTVCSSLPSRIRPLPWVNR